jgi:hypothetical protein
VVVAWAEVDKSSPFFQRIRTSPRAVTTKSSTINCVQRLDPHDPWGFFVRPTRKKWVSVDEPDVKSAVGAQCIGNPLARNGPDEIVHPGSIAGPTRTGLMDFFLHLRFGM